MLPKTAEYALRAMVWLASDPSHREAAGPLAARTKIPRRYLHKVLQSLVHGGLVDSISGPGGGYALCRPAEKITILDIVDAVAPLERIRRCPLGITSHTRLCPLHRELDHVYAEVEQAFKRVTLADLGRSTSKIVPLCEVGR
ncbi:MAG TPA: Rrf2 family transcriptional regulator [Lacipirellulaceae bacterium]|nr:Rrf2 family transcriptional regulator [Lacipirellulaceae bacterium]